jgi:hypothetical protein
VAYGTVISLNDTQLGLVLGSGSGPVAAAVRDYAKDELYDLAVATISDPWPGGPNPPPSEGGAGPPYMRSGDMVNSLSVIDLVGGGQPETIIQVTAVHRGRVYGLILRDRGYRFLPDQFYT